MLILRFLLTLALAWCAGQLVSKLKLPAILGWLIAGMALGPHGLALMSDAVLDTGWYNTLVHLLECAVGLMIGTELVGSKLRRSGRSILITTLTQSMGTFAVVSLVFGLVFAWQGIPVYLAFVFGGIALATAPAPALSIVREFDTHGPVTDTLLPMAALDDIVGCVVFFSVMAAVSGHLAQGSLPVWIIPLIILLPLALGALVGWPAGLLLKKPRGRGATLALVLGGILCTAALGMAASRLVPGLNFMLMGMAFSAVFANLVDEERLDSIMQTFQPVLGVGMIVVILNLGAPLDYHLVLGAGVFTALYILARAVGKYTGAYVGARATHAPATVRRYLGLTLLPHSGVSLVFTGVAVSVLQGPAPDCARILQGTIAAAAVINELIAVVAARQGFALAGELHAPASVPDSTTA